MAIENANQLGFTTVTKKGDNVASRDDWSYADDFGLVVHTKAEIEDLFKTMPDDGAVVVVHPRRLEFLKWNCRRSTSENMTNSVAKPRGTSTKDIVEAAKTKAASLHRGEMTSAGDGTLGDPMEVEMKRVIVHWLVGKNIATKMANELSKDTEKAVEYAVKVVMENDTPDNRQNILARWTKAAQIRVAALEDQPEAGGDEGEAAELLAVAAGKTTQANEKPSA